jgi:uncharacterized membrane protein YkoI
MSTLVRESGRADELPKGYFMRTPVKLFAVAMLAAGLTGVGCHADSEKDEKGEKEETHQLTEMPAPVQEAVKNLLGDKKLGDIDTENDGGKTTYEVEYKVGDAEYAATFSPTGEILEHEVDVDLTAVPSAAIDAVKKAHPDGTIKEASIVEAEGNLFYEFDVKAGDKTMETRVKPDGIVISDAEDKD